MRAHSAKVGERPHVAVEEGDLVLAVVEPDEVVARVHQPHQEVPGPTPLTPDLGGDLGALAPPTAQVAPHQRHTSPSASTG